MEYGLAYMRVGACNGRTLDMVGTIRPEPGLQFVEGSTPENYNGHLYEVRASDSATYVFNTCLSTAQTSYDTVLCLYDDRWNLVAENDDFCAELQSHLNVYLRSGTYYLAVSGSWGDKGGYRLVYFTVASCNGRSPLNRGTVRPTIDIQSASGELALGEAHAYTVEATTAATYTFSLCSHSDFPDYMCLYDANWDLIYENDNACRRDARIKSALPAGTYWIVVSGHETSEGHYDMAYYKVPMCSRSELRVPAGTIRPEVEVQTVTGEVTTRLGDRYEVRVATAGVHVFSLCGPHGQASWDTHLCLFDRDGEWLADNDEACGHQSEIVRFLPPGEYVIAVASSMQQGEGPYTLAYSVQPSGLFIRCDHNCDGNVDLSDAVNGLSQLFLGPAFSACCPQVTLCNEDGVHDLSDWVFLLAYQFLGGPPPGAPYPECGGEGCSEHPKCN
jgi:hypothetical protein